MNKRHFNQLDSIRGLAAISVMLGHFVFIFPQVADVNFEHAAWYVKLIKYSPAHMFIAGHEAVLLFFILSGFVLSIPFNNNQNFSYSTYIIKRICRIYLPYLVAISLAMLMSVTFYSSDMSGLSSQINWESSLNIKAVLEHLFFIGSYQNGLYDPVIWSLIHEMRISIIFPFLMYFVLKNSWKKTLLFAVLVSIVGYVMTTISINVLGIKTDFFHTLYFTSLFIIGALLAKYRVPIVQRIQLLSRPVKVLLILFGILAYTNSWWTYSIPVMNNEVFHISLINDYLTVWGIVIFIVMSFSLKTLLKLLETKLLMFFGKISYSLYLYHVICLKVLVSSLYGLLNTEVILLITLIISIAVATLSYKYIELPSIRLGKKLVSKYNNDKLERKKNIPA